MKGSTHYSHTPESGTYNTCGHLQAAARREDLALRIYYALVCVCVCVRASGMNLSGATLAFSVYRIRG